MKIGILVFGAASGVEGGLQHFCFLSAWVLLFDCVLLFSFYTTILYIKLEVNTIKCHVEMREALVDDGVSGRVAENVAQSNWLRADGEDQPRMTIFGQRTLPAHINWFKFVMVSGFFLFNALNIYTIPLRGASFSPCRSSWAGGFGGVIALPPVDPFGVASDGLDVMLDMAKQKGQETIVTILFPIRYKLKLPSIHHDLPRVLPRTAGTHLLTWEGFQLAGEWWAVCSRAWRARSCRNGFWSPLP
jgi:hydroxymethylglutaryl-CoA reductase (NADPH)